MTPLPTSASTSKSKSSATTSSSTESCYKLNIMQRLGGENVFEFIVLGMVERLQQDETLKPFFANFGSSSLDSLQRSVLKAMFTKHTTTNDNDEYDVDGFILLRYYSVIEQGFNETHFDIVMMKHFLESLEDAWVDDDVLQDAIQIVKSFRPIFVVHNVTTTTTNNNNNNNKNYLLEHRPTSQQQQQLQRRRTTTTIQEGDEHEEESSTERSKITTETSSSSSEGDKKEAVTSTRRGSSGEYFLNLMRPRGAKRTRKAGVSQ